MRADLLPRGDPRRHDRKLERRGRDIALADPAADGLAGIPGLPERASLPFGVGDDALLLSGEPDVMDLAKPELPRHLGKAIDADAIHRVVEIDVAGLLDRLVQINRAVSLPAAEIMAPEREAAGTGHVLLGGDEAGLEPCESGTEL